MSWQDILKSPVKGKHILGKGNTGLKGELYQLMGLDITNHSQKEELNTKLDAIETPHSRVKTQITMLKNEMNGDSVIKPDYFSNPPLSIPNLFNEKTGERIKIPHKLRYFDRLDYMEDYLSSEKKDDRNLSDRATSIIQELLSNKQYEDLNKYLIGEVSYDRKKFVFDKVLVKINIKPTKNSIHIRQNKCKKLLDKTTRKQLTEDLKDNPELLGYNIDGIIFTLDKTNIKTLWDEATLYAKTNADTKQTVAAVRFFKIKGHINEKTGIKRENIVQNNKEIIVTGEGWITKDKLRPLAGVKKEGQIEMSIFAKLLNYAEYTEFKQGAISAKQRTRVSQVMTPAKLNVEGEISPNKLIAYYDMINNISKKSSMKSKFLYGSGDGVLVNNSHTDNLDSVNFILKNETKDMAKSEIDSFGVVLNGGSQTNKGALVKKLEDIFLGNEGSIKIENIIENEIDRQLIEDNFTKSGKSWNKWVTSIKLATGDDGERLLKIFNEALDNLDTTSKSSKSTKMKNFENTIKETLQVDKLTQEVLDTLFELEKVVIDYEKNNTGQKFKLQNKKIEGQITKWRGTTPDPYPLLTEATDRQLRSLVLGTETFEDVRHPFNREKGIKEEKKVTVVKGNELMTAVKGLRTNFSEEEEEEIEIFDNKINPIFDSLLEVGFDFDTNINNDDSLYDLYYEYDDEIEDDEITLAVLNKLKDLFLERYDDIRNAILDEINKSTIYVIENSITDNKRGSARILPWLKTNLGIG